MPWIDFTAGAGGQWSMAFLRNIFSVRNLMWVVVIVFLVWWFMPGLLPGSSLLRSLSWSNTDFSKSSVDMSEITSGGPRKDGIPSIDKPNFTPASKVDIPSTVPVISLHLNGDARAYPLGILMSHEIVNDRVGGIPVTVTYCPLCNSAIVFDARLDGMELEFGTSGNLRNSDLVMYDRQTESWWQQFLGEAIVGELTGKKN
jgi:hypothetical protein